MFKIINLEEINKTYSRETGNQLITEVSDLVKQNLSNEYIFVRYMGPKFAIVFSGIDLEAVTSFMKELKKRIENIEVETVNTKKVETVKPKINVVLSTYYKGTALEGLTKKLEEYIDEAPVEENTINYL